MDMKYDHEDESIDAHRALIDKVTNELKIRIVSRMIYECISDDKYISRITGTRLTEIEHLRDNMSFEQAGYQLRLSHDRLLKYIRRGLVSNSNGIPRYAVELMKDPVYCFLMQLDYQERKLLTQTPAERLQELAEELYDCEQKYGGKYHDLFGHLTTAQIDVMDDAFDLFAWRDLEEELRDIRKGLKED